ncbi:hypothetical protein [Glutamicibacter uratoxydans]|uniref:hypothetical protein n=1 Tax=Glutamicibacter uratoxydans TaxID=43667 RepID=UPI0011424236|nr:hypothetical protein [Glutamicibacter uratoxydans]
MVKDAAQEHAAPESNFQGRHFDSLNSGYGLAFGCCFTVAAGAVDLPSAGSSFAVPFGVAALTD